MVSQIPALLIEFGIQTAFLLAALWIMIKLQKLNYNFPGLLGCALLASALDKIPYVGHYIAVGALLYCVWLLTRSEYVDVAFTVFVGYALMFGMNLWLIGALMGDLRPSVREARAERRAKEAEAQAAAAADTNEPAMADETPPVKEATNGPATNTVVTNAPAAAAVVTNSAPTDSVGTNSPAPRASATNTPAGTNAAAPGTNAVPSEKPPAPINPEGSMRSRAIVRTFSIKALTENGTKSSVVLDTGVKAYTIFVGETVLMDTAQGVSAVRFDEFRKDSLILSIDGEKTLLWLH